MSEPSSLYARVRLSEAAFSAFQASTPALPSQYTDWLPWLASKHFYGTISQATIDQLGEEDFILIFPFFWGGPPEAHVVITPGSSRLVTEVAEAAEAEATEQLGKIYETLQSAYSNEET